MPSWGNVLMRFGVWTRDEVRVVASAGVMIACAAELRAVDL